ncbi:DCN1-like protein 5 [Dispira simplex]|nr:DCN1-like protein 5 [Dispira simplex]
MGEFKNRKCRRMQQTGGRIGSPSGSTCTKLTGKKSTTTQASKRRKRPAAESPTNSTPSSAMVGHSKRNAKNKRTKGTCSVSQEDPKMIKWFTKYKAAGEDRIDHAGIEALCTDLGIEPGSDDFFVLSWKLQAATMGYYSRQEFIEGLSRLQCWDIPTLRRCLPQWAAERDNDSIHKSFYTWIFGFTKTPTQRSLDVNVAFEILPLVIHDNPHVAPFIQFLQDKAQIAALNKDQWTSFYEFCNTIPEDCVDYDELAAWPTLLDDYVRWRRAQLHSPS